MQYLDQPNGLKTRTACVQKLDKSLGNSGPATLAIIVANSDGTFTPAVLLSQAEIHMARPLAETGIYVMGPAPPPFR